MFPVFALVGQACLGNLSEVVEAPEGRAGTPVTRRCRQTELV